MNDHISSTKNPLIRDFVRLHRQRARRDRGEILIEGPIVFAAALEAGCVPTTVLATADDIVTQNAVHSHPDVRFHTVADHVLKAASDTSQPQSPVATFQRPASPELSDRNVVVLVGIGDPGNVGTIIRTAAALGWDVAATPDTADVWSPKVLRAGAGTHFSTTIAEGQSVAEIFSDRPHVLIATVVAGGQSDVDIDRPIALLIGSEAHGLAIRELELADHRLTIPMPGGTESLNAAVAAALGMWISTRHERPVPIR